MTIENAISAALENPDAALLMLDKLDAEESLPAFIRLMWPYADPSDYVSNWHIDAICEHLVAVGKGQLGGPLLINIPPGHQKSLSVCVFWPAWEWGPNDNPHFRFMFTSYRGDLAIRDGDRARMLIKSDLYQRLWGDRFAMRSTQDQKTRYANDKGGYRFSTSIAGIMGEGGDFVILDDPHNVEQAESDDVREDTIERITMALPTRVRSKWGNSITIMQRLHSRDYSGHLIDHEPDLVHLCLPARYELDHPHKTITPLNFEDPRTEDGELLFPGLFNEERVVKLERALSARSGSYAVAGQLQQRPAPREGGLFHRDWFEIVDRVPVGVQMVTVRGWDLAGTEKKKSPRTAGIKVAAFRTPGDEDWSFIILDVIAVQESSGKVEKRFKATTKADGKDVIQDIPQDPGQAGKSQVRSMVRMVPGYNVRFSPETGSKEQRASLVSAQAEAGNVYLLRAPWNDAFLSEAETFPKGTFKDQIDATSRAFDRLWKMIDTDEDEAAAAVNVPKGR